MKDIVGYLKKNINIIVNICGISSIVLYPILFLYSKNVEDVLLNSIFDIILLFLIIECCIYICLIVWFKNGAKASFSTAIIMLVLMNFSILESIGRIFLPFFRYWHMVTCVFLIIIYLASLKKRKNELVMGQICKMISIVFWGLILWNIVPQSPNIIEQNFSSNQDTGVVSTGSTAGNMPNIYYMVFDEYSNFDFMKKYYNYDNMEFADYLENKGFNVSYSSSNENYVTELCMTNTLNLDYMYDMGMKDVPEMKSKITESRHNSKAFEILRHNNYSIHGIGLPEFYGLADIEGGNKAEKTTMKGKTFKELVIEKTIFYPYYVYDSSSKLQEIQASVKYLLDMDINPTQSSFVLFHIEPSHTPFVMDEFGQAIPAQYAQEWNDKRYYKGTYIYTTKLMKEIVEEILEKDKDSIIVLSSDHSARAAQSGYDNMFEEKDKCKILNAVYYRGEYMDIEGLSAINTLRTIFNRLFDMNYEMIETYPLMPIEEYQGHE